MTGRERVRKALNHETTDRIPIMASNGNIFETSWYMRGMDTLMMDFVLNPDIAHAIAGRVTDFYLEYFERVLEAGQGEFDLVFTADDLGGQQGLLISRAMWGGVHQAVPRVPERGHPSP